MARAKRAYGRGCRTTGLLSRLFSLALFLLVLWMLVYGVYLLATGETDHGVFLIVIGGGGLIAVGGGALRVVGARREEGFFAAIKAAVWPSPPAPPAPSAPAPQEPEQKGRKKGRKRAAKTPK